MKQFYLVASLFFAVFAIAQANTPIDSSSEYPPTPRIPGLRPQSVIVITTATPTAVPTATPTVVPTGTPTPVPTISPGFVQDTTSSGQALVNSTGVDYGNYQPPNANTVFTTMGFHHARSGGDYDSIIQAGFNTYYNSGSPNPNVGFCGSLATAPYDTQATITTKIIAGETGTLGTSYSGGSSPPLNVSTYLGCIFAEGLNEFDNVQGTSSTPTNGTLSNAITSTEVTNGTQVTENVPSYSTSCGAGGGNLFMCGNLYLYVSDGANSEDVRETCVNNGSSEPDTDSGVSCPNVGGIPQFTAVFQHPHAAGTSIVLDVPMTMAYSSWEMYQVIKQASTGHPEFASIQLTTQPMAAPGSNWTYGEYSGQDHLAGYDAAMMNISQLYDPLGCPSGCHLWTNASDSAYYITDALNFHYGANGGKTYPTVAGGSNDYANRLYDSTNGILVFAGGLYPWQQGTVYSENTIAAGDEFCNGDIGVNVPYCPVQANTNSLPQIINADYVATATFAVMTMQLQGAGTTQANGRLYEPVLTDRSSTILANSFFDPAFNPKPNYYSRSNSFAFLMDPTYNPVTFTPGTLTYPNPSTADWCTSWWNVDSPYKTPTNCTTYHYAFRVGAADVMFIHRMQGSGQDLFPQSNNAAYCQNQTVPTPNPNATQTNYGQCTGVAPPSPFPTIAPTTVPLQFAGTDVPKARVYQQSLYCGIPTNTEWQANASPVPDTTPAPSYTTAPNDACMMFSPGPLITPQPSGTMLINAPDSNVASAIMICHSTATGPCDSIVAPVPMLSPQPTPAVCPTPKSGMISGQPCPYNLYRTGVYSNVVAR